MSEEQQRIVILVALIASFTVLAINGSPFAIVVLLILLFV